MRGVTVGPIECPGLPPCGYGSPYSAVVLDELVRLGANWVALTPHGRVWSLASTDIRLNFEASFDESRRDLTEMVHQAHARGLKVIVIPHVFVESSGLKGDEPDRFRGKFDMESRRHWARYQASYRRFVTTWAEVAAAAHVDAFSIGTEYRSFSGRFGNFWTQLIREIRGVFPGLLTYSANWYEEVYAVPFWDQLDFIGVDAFFDLAQHEGATFEEYRNAAERYVAELRELARTLEMPVVFMELGYAARPDGGVQPWRWPENVGTTAVDEAEQARAYAAITEAFLKEPWFAGFLVWRYSANFEDLQEPAWGFSPYAKSAEELLRRIFHTRWAADPEGWAWQTSAPLYGGNPRFDSNLLPLPMARFGLGGPL